MRSRLIRPLLVFEFLVAIEVWLSFWSQVGGQYHLDLMFWPWKFGLTVGAAWLTTAITAELFRGNGAVSRRAIAYAALLALVIITAGIVTYYYHVNEPADDESNSDTPTSVTRLGLPDPAGFCGYHRLAHGAAKGLLEFRHVRDHSVHAITVDGMRVCLCS